MESCELLEWIVELEGAADGLPAEDQAPLLRSFAEEVVGATIRIDSGVVLTTYRRDWLTRPYFALNNKRESYLYLEELDSDFQERLSRHEHWASISAMCPGRQLMFELAIDQGMFEALREGEEISCSCEAAAVIRGGKSVYCSLLSFHQSSPGS